MKYLISFSIAFLILLLACTSDPPPLNPNGDSELAILMRQMFEDGMAVKQDLEENKRSSKKLKHDNLLTAEATEPEKAESDTYKALAKTYLELAEQVNDKNNPHREEAYSNMVNSCLQCHKALCPGPIVKINKMVLDKEI